MCRPVFLPETDAEGKPVSYLELRKMVHPCVKMKGSFIPNDTVLDPKND
jgi:DNA mismatch repair ATPase MutS